MQASNEETQTHDPPTAASVTEDAGNASNTDNAKNTAKVRKPRGKATDPNEQSESGANTKVKVSDLIQLITMHEYMLSYTDTPTQKNQKHYILYRKGSREIGVGGFLHDAETGTTTINFDSVVSVISVGKSTFPAHLSLKEIINTAKDAIGTSMDDCKFNFGSIPQNNRLETTKHIITPDANAISALLYTALCVNRQVALSGPEAADKLDDLKIFQEAIHHFIKGPLSPSSLSNQKGAYRTRFEILQGASGFLNEIKDTTKDSALRAARTAMQEMTWALPGTIDQYVRQAEEHRTHAAKFLAKLKAGTPESQLLNELQRLQPCSDPISIDTLEKYMGVGRWAVYLDQKKASMQATTQIQRIDRTNRPFSLIALQNQLDETYFKTQVTEYNTKFGKQPPSRAFEACWCDYEAFEASTHTVWGITEEEKQYIQENIHNQWEQTKPEMIKYIKYGYVDIIETGKDAEGNPNTRRKHFAPYQDMMAQLFQRILDKEAFTDRKLSELVLAHFSQTTYRYVEITPQINRVAADDRNFSKCDVDSTTTASDGNLVTDAAARDKDFVEKLEDLAWRIQCFINLERIKIIFYMRVADAGDLERIIKFAAQALGSLDINPDFILKLFKSIMYCLMMADGSELANQYEAVSVYDVKEPRPYTNKKELEVQLSRGRIIPIEQDVINIEDDPPAVVPAQADVAAAGTLASLADGCSVATSRGPPFHTVLKDNFEAEMQIFMQRENLESILPIDDNFQILFNQKAFFSVSQPTECDDKKRMNNDAKRDILEAMKTDRKAGINQYLQKHSMRVIHDALTHIPDDKLIDAHLWMALAESCQEFTKKAAAGATSDMNYEIPEKLTMSAIIQTLGGASSSGDIERATKRARTDS